MTKFVVVRGPCGAGKSTVAQRLFERVTRPTALVERDRYMFMFQAADDPRVPDQELIELDILKCFEHGFDVIFEGNFRPGTHAISWSGSSRSTRPTTMCSISM